MKAPPEENRKVLAYNGCRTQWQALDDYDRPVDFITGINSNIVKVTLSEYFDLTVNKIWDDENNKWELRPDSIDIILKKSGVEIERKQITKGNLSVTFTDLLSDDAKFYSNVNYSFIIRLSAAVRRIGSVVYYTPSKIIFLVVFFIVFRKNLTKILPLSKEEALKGGRVEKFFDIFRLFLL